MLDASVPLSPLGAQGKELLATHARLFIMEGSMRLRKASRRYISVYVYVGADLSSSKEYQIYNNGYDRVYNKETTKWKKWIWMRQEIELR